MQRAAPPLPEAEEPGAAAYLATRTAGLVDDIPFIPLKPYERRWFQIGWRSLIIVALVIATFFPSVGKEWLWQDDRLLASDFALRSSWGPGAIWKDAFSAELSPMARSLAWVEFHLPGRDKAVVFRIVSLAMHAWTCLFGWYLMRRLNVPGAWLIAAVWAVHPSTLPTVAWPTRQGDLLAAAMSVTAVWAYLAARRIRPYVNERIWTDPAYHEDEESEPVWPWVVIALAASIALPCGSAVPVFAVLGVIAIEAWHRGLTKARAIALGILLILTIAARLMLPHGARPGAGVATAGIATFAEAVAAAPWSAAHALVPFELPFVYDRWQWAGVSWAAVLGVISALLVVVPLVLRRGWLLPVAIAGAFAVLHGLSVPRPSRAVAAADLLPYASGATVLALAIAAVILLLRRDGWRPAERALRWGGGFVLILAAGAITFARGPVYADAEAAWQQTIATNPESALAPEELAAKFVEQGFIDEAGIQLDRVADRQRGISWYLARGRVFDAQKRYAEAVGCYETAHQQQPDDISTTTILAEAYANAGRPDQAAAYYDRLLERVKDDPSLYANAGLARFRLGKAHDAVDLYRAALKLDPDHIAAHINLANALFELKEYSESSEHLKAVIKIDPKNYVAFMNAGVMLFRLGDPVKAEGMFRAAVHIDPRSADAYAKLGKTLAAQNKMAEAAWCETQARRLEADANLR